MKFPVLVNIAVDFTEKNYTRAQFQIARKKSLTVALIIVLQPFLLVVYNNNIICFKYPFTQSVFDFTPKEITAIS